MSGYNSARFWATKLLKYLLPTPGNVFFTLLVVGVLVWVQRAGAIPGYNSSASTNTIAYQGRLADAGGNPLTGTYNMTFRLYDVASGGSALWTELWTGADGVEVSDGLFNVLLGSITPLPQNLIENNNTLWLGIKVGTDSEMMPCVQLGSVPFAIQSLIVPDDSISSEKLALYSDTMCLATDTVINLPGNWERIAIPGMALSLSLAKPGKVLVWVSGRHNYTTTGIHIGTTVFLDGSELVDSGELITTSGWQDFAIIRRIDIPAGNHTLDLRAYGQSAGEMTYAGQNQNTCFEYVVFN